MEWATTYMPLKGQKHEMKVKSRSPGSGGVSTHWVPVTIVERLPTGHYAVTGAHFETGDVSPRKLRALGIYEARAATKSRSGTPGVSGISADESERITKRCKHFEISAKLGRGAFSQVFLGRDVRTNQRLAFKVLKATRTDKTMREVSIMQALANGGSKKKKVCPYILRLHELVQGTLSQSPAIVVEFLERIPFRRTMCLAHKARVCVRQLLVALAYCHDIGFAHRDLKPSNILITEDKSAARANNADLGLVLKLCDWGLARETHQDPMELMGSAGSPSYKAPGLAFGTACRMKFVRAKHLPSTDIWSFGCLLAESMLSLRSPIFKTKKQLDKNNRRREDRDTCLALLAKYTAWTGLASLCSLLAYPVCVKLLRALSGLTDASRSSLERLRALLEALYRAMSLDACSLRHSETTASASKIEQILGRCVEEGILVVVTALTALLTQTNTRVTIFQGSLDHSEKKTEAVAMDWSLWTELWRLTIGCLHLASWTTTHQRHLERYMPPNEGTEPTLLQQLQECTRCTQSLALWLLEAAVRQIVRPRDDTRCQLFGAAIFSESADVVGGDSSAIADQWHRRVKERFPEQFGNLERDAQRGSGMRQRLRAQKSEVSASPLSHKQHSEAVWSSSDYDSDSDDVHMAGSSGGGSAAATALPSAGAAPSSQATALLGEGFHVGFCRAVSISCQQQMTRIVNFPNGFLPEAAEDVRSDKNKKTSSPSEGLNSELPFVLSGWDGELEAVTKPLSMPGWVRLPVLQWEARRLGQVPKLGGSQSKQRSQAPVSVAARQVDRQSRRLRQLLLRVKNGIDQLAFLQGYLSKELPNIAHRHRLQQLVEGQVRGNEDLCASPSGLGSTIDPTQASAYMNEDVLRSSVQSCIKLLPKDDYLLDWHGKDDGVETKRLVNTLPFTFVQRIVSLVPQFRALFCNQLRKSDFDSKARWIEMADLACACLRMDPRKRVTAQAALDYQSFKP